jgi:hypothetical protein
MMFTVSVQRSHQKVGKSFVKPITTHIPLTVVITKAATLLSGDYGAVVLGRLRSRLVGGYSSDAEDAAKLFDCSEPPLETPSDSLLL